MFGKMSSWWLAMAAALALAACGSTAAGGGPNPQDTSSAQDVASDVPPDVAPDVEPASGPDLEEDLAPDVPAEPEDISTLPIVPSDQGTFAARFVRNPDPATPSGNTLTMELMDTGGQPLEGANIKAKPWMPSMGHGSPKKPVVKDDGGGHYTITNLFFSMPGKWLLWIDVTTDSGQDRFTLIYPI